MKKVETLLDGKVTLIQLEPFEDHRGKFVELSNVRELNMMFEPYFTGRTDVILPFFVQDDISISHKNVLRGIHGDDVTWKLITCIHGAFYVVVVNPETKKWVNAVLSAGNNLQLLVPPKYGIGILALDEPSILHYKQTQYYHGMQAQFTIRWDDPEYNIPWPTGTGSLAPVLSERDGGKKNE
jgi:dTDP-4-dehydrorhamnose 3,5-epimerase